MLILLAVVPMVLTTVPNPAAEPASLQLPAMSRQQLEPWTGVRPRLYLTAAEAAQWRTRINGSHKRLWDLFAREFDHMKTSQPPSRRWGRGDGNQLAHLAFAWMMTQDRDLLAAAKRHLLALAAMDVWDPDADLLHGHLLTGAAVAYDWLYGELTDAERATVRNALAREAQLQFEASTTGRGYWRNQFLQNHGHVNLAGLAFAAVALHGEDERTTQWLALADWFFENVFAVSNTDGTSVEGLSYGAYALEFCMRYAELAKRFLGRDYYADNAWFARWPDYLIHSTLPVMSKRNWAMTFGDSPRAAESHLPVHTMYRIASRYSNGHAQWMGNALADMLGLHRSPHLCILWHDPSVKPIPRDQLPTMGHMTDTGQVMMRSGWGNDAVLMGLHSGPWQGHDLDGKVTRDLGTAHAHPDINSFQIYAYGQWLAIDPLYTYRKRTANHSTVLVNGAGQLGEGSLWFNAKDALTHSHTASVLTAESHADYDYVAVDGTGAYHPGLGLKRFVRHVVFVKPDVFVIIDDLQAKPTGVMMRYPWDTLELQAMATGGRNVPYAIPTAKQCQASLIFKGQASRYDIDVAYFDNSPGQARYELLVDDKVVSRWKNVRAEADLHIQVLRDVALTPGQRVAVRANPTSDTTKFAHMVLYDRQQPRAARFDWLLHAESDATVAQPSDGLVTIVQNGAALDVHLLAREAQKTTVSTWDVQLPASIPQTQRLAVQPTVTDNAAVVIAVLHARREKQPALAKVRLAGPGAEPVIEFIRDGQTVTVEVSPETRKVKVSRKR